MANISRYEPFDVTIEPFDDLFRGFFRPVRMEGLEQPMQVKMDIRENDHAYTVHADIPGVKKEDIQVTINGNQVTISAEVKRVKEEKEGDKILRSERYSGKVYRSFALGQDIDEGAALAKYTEGVLELTLPKKQAAASRKLAIQ